MKDKKVIGMNPYNKKQIAFLLNIDEIADIAEKIVKMEDVNSLDPEEQKKDLAFRIHIMERECI